MIVEALFSMCLVERIRDQRKDQLMHLTEGCERRSMEEGIEHTMRESINMILAYLLAANVRCNDGVTEAKCSDRLEEICRRPT